MAPRLGEAERSEPHVEAGAQRVRIKRDVAVAGEPAIEAAIEVAEIEVKVLGLDAHIAHNAGLDTGTHGPAHLGIAARGKDGCGRIDIADREPCRQVRQKTVERVSRPAAYGRHPVIAGAASERAIHDSGAFDAGPVDVAFGAHDHLSELPVVADRAADEAAGNIELVDAVPLRLAPAPAAVDAQIKPGPVVDR